MVGPSKRQHTFQYSSRVRQLAETDLCEDVFTNLHWLYKVCTEAELIPYQEKREPRFSMRQEVMETALI